MKIAIRAPKDFGIGLIFVSTGMAGYLLSRDYPFGSSARMGPGYFPFIISLLLLIVGAIAIIQSFRLEGESIGSLAWKPMIHLAGAIIAFALLVERAGLFLAMASAILIAASASERFRLDWKALLGMIAVIALCALVFVKGLGVPMPLVGPWIRAIAPDWLGI